MVLATIFSSRQRFNGLVLLLTFLATFFTSSTTIAEPHHGQQSQQKNPGVFLVANPDIDDPRFKQSVVLVSRHARGNAVGVIINQPTEVKLSSMFSTSDNLTGHAGLLYNGGPVNQQNIIFVVQTQGGFPDNSLRVFDNVFISFDQQVLREALVHPMPLQGLKVFSGYSGWAPGQLQAEVVRGDWFMVEADPDLIFNKAPEDIWPHLIRQIDPKLLTGRQPDNLL